MKLNIPFNGSLRLIFHNRSSGIDRDQSVFDTWKTLGSITLGKVQIEWIRGDRDQNDTCHSSICSTPFLLSIQSGFNDASFPAEAMEHFSFVPENMSFSSMMYTDNCGFVNLYTETAVKSKYPGILTNDIKWHIIRLHFNWHNKTPDWWTIWAHSFDAPLVYLNDLNQSTQSVTAVHNLYCARKLTDDSSSSSRINTVEVDKVFSYIHEHLFDDRIVFFVTVNAIKNQKRIFCNFMINIKNNDNFYIDVSNQRYFNTIRLLVYHKFIEKSKKKFLQRATYSCVEMGFCLDAFDRAFGAVIEKRLSNVIASDCIYHD
uniref:Uncharacterized protein n=1 Tax=Tetranychus urticae TaxID=32264 RepID=T1JRS5_TETUR